MYPLPGAATRAGAASTARRGKLSIVPAVEAWFYICALVLAAAGMLELRDPEPTAGALRAMGWPSAPALVAALGAGQVAAGTTGLFVGGPAAAVTIGGFYLGFAVFVAAALLRGTPLQSCGCFGRDDTPPDLIHLVVNLGAAAGATWFGVASGQSLVSRLGSVPAVGAVLYAAGLAAGAWGVYLALTWRAS